MSPTSNPTGIQTPDQIVMTSPMLAKGVDFNKLEYPVLCQPKLDGIRAVIRNGVALSRSMKPIPNYFIQDYFKIHSAYLEGMDGELIVGDMLAKEAFQNTTSGVMSRFGEPDFKYYVFDMWNMPDFPADRRRQTYEVRVKNAASMHAGERLKEVPTFTCHEPNEVKELMAKLLDEGAEGMILRHQQAPYKFGRSTINEGCLLKWKQFVDTEGEIVGFEELMRNENEAFTSETGHQKRSAHQAGKIPANTLGALIVKFGDGSATVNVGSGFDMALRQQVWDNKPDYIGKTVKYKYFPIGMKDLPRHPIFLGFRAMEDM